MEIETARVRLEEITPGDTEDIHRLYILPEIDRYNTIGIPDGIDKTEKIVGEMLKAQNAVPRKDYWWKVTAKDTGKLTGLVSLRTTADRFRSGEISYELHPSMWGRGLATEIARAIISFGFDTLSLHRIVAGTATENIRSIRVMEKAGMSREGTLRKELPIRGEWKDCYLYSVLEDDPREC